MTTNDVHYITDSVGSSEPIAVVELADELGIYKQSIFKIAKRLGIQPVKRRDSTRGNQEIALVSKADAAAIRDEYARVRRNGIQDSGDASQFAPDEGWFYLIKFEPEYDPGRFKVGFTTDLDGRLRPPPLLSAVRNLLQDVAVQASLGAHCYRLHDCRHRAAPHRSVPGCLVSAGTGNWGSVLRDDAASGPGCAS